MKKIAIIINSLYAIGGEERVVSIMANEFAKYYDVTIFSSETRKLEKGPKNSYFLSDRIHVSVVDSARDSLIVKYIKIFYRIVGFPNNRIFRKILKHCFYPKNYLYEWSERLNKGNYDIVIASSNTMLLGMIREKLAAKCISWEHGSYEGYFGKKDGAFKTREKTFSECGNKLDAVIVLNDDIKEKYRKNLGVDTVVIPNPKSFCSDNKVSYLNKVIVTCGRLESEKGFDDLINAFSMFNKIKPDWKLVIIGGGRLEKKLREQIQKLGLNESITITGYTDNVSDELVKGSIFAMTSRWEGFPMTITEALEMGLPVVAYGIPALKPLVTDGVEGYIVPPFDREKLVSKMVELANDDKGREKMSLAAIEKAKTLTPEIIYERWKDVFERL